MKNEVSVNIYIHLFYTPISIIMVTHRILKGFVVDIILLHSDENIYVAYSDKFKSVIGQGTTESAAVQSFIKCFNYFYKTNLNIYSVN